MTSNLKLIQQGAEAKIFLDEKNNLISKDRISKSYRIPELDKKIIKPRTKAEKKLLEKASKIINAPNPLPLKEPNIIKMPFIDGEKLSDYLNDFPFEKQKQIMTKIGESVAKLHKADIIHGDLTTSNMILVKNLGENLVNDKSHNVSKDKSADRLNIDKKRGDNKLNDLRGREDGNGFKIFFIDFGLGYISKKIEDKAVDIHLFKQALEAKHFQHWEKLFEEFQKSYSKNNSEAKQIFERMTAVERRGRYRH